jgi:hypothetical protein
MTIMLIKYRSKQVLQKYNTFVTYVTYVEGIVMIVISVEFANDDFPTTQKNNTRQICRV